MRATLKIDDALMARLCDEAARRQCTVSEVVEIAVQRFFQLDCRQSGSLPPLPVFSSGGLLVDSADRGELDRLGWARPTAR
jgi:hypothetical protein